MKLVHKNIEKQIDFSNNFFHALIVENQDEFYSLVKQLFSQIDGDGGGWVLSHNGKILQIEDSLCVLADFFNLSNNGKKIENAINSKVASVFKHKDFIQDLQEFNSRLHLLAEKVLEEIDLPLEINGELSYATLTKLMAFKVSEEEKLIDKLLTFVDVNIKLKNTMVFAFVNLQFVLNEEDLLSFIKHLQYLQIGVLLISSVDSHCFKNAEKIIIDKDLCLI